MREALYLRHFTPHVDVFLSQATDLAPVMAQSLRAAGVTVHAAPVQRIDRRASGIAITTGTPTSAPQHCDALYSALGIDVHASLAVHLGADCDDDGYLVADRHQQTRVPGLYCAGDVARGLNQISVAIGEAAIAASAMHLQLARAAA